jgi:peroxiredoxin
LFQLNYLEALSVLVKARLSHRYILFVLTVLFVTSYTVTNSFSASYNDDVLIIDQWIAKAKDVSSSTMVDLERRANAGDIDAQMILAYALTDVSDVPKDPAKALNYVITAAQQNNPFAQAMIIYLLNAYRIETFVTREYAFETALASAKQGNVFGIFNAGSAYMLGSGTRQNLKKAYDLLTKSFELGHPDAPSRLCRLRDIGYGAGDSVLVQKLDDHRQNFTYRCDAGPLNTRGDSKNDLNPVVPAKGNKSNLKSAALKAEEERTRAERAKREQVAAESARLAAENAEHERQAKVEQEQAAAEAARITAEKLEQDRLAALKAEEERLARARAKAEQEQAAAEAARRAAEKREQDRLALLKTEEERLAKAKVEQDKAAVETIRIAVEKLEQDRLVLFKSEGERLAKARAKVEQDQAAAEAARRSAEKLEQDRLALLKAEKERLARAKAEQDKAAAETIRIAVEKLEQDRVALFKAEEERSARVKAEQDKVAVETIRIAVEKLEQDRVALFKAEEGRQAKAEQDKAAAKTPRKAVEKPEQDRVAPPKTEGGRKITEKAQQDRLAVLKEKENPKDAEKSQQKGIEKAKTDAAPGAVPVKGMPKIGQAMPNFKLSTNSGQSISLEYYRGSVLLIDFYNSGCQSCRGYVPNLLELTRKYGKQGLQVVGMSIDKDAARAVQEDPPENRRTYPLARADETIQQDFGVRSVPAIFVVDMNGRVAGVFQTFNAQTPRKIDSLVKELLAEIYKPAL